MAVHLTDTYFIAHIHILPMFALMVAAAIPFWPLFRKAGFAGPLSLLMPVPGVNLILLYIVAFSGMRKRNQAVN